MPGAQWRERFATGSGLPSGGEPVDDALVIPYRQDEAGMRAYLEWEVALGEERRATPRQSPR